MSNGKVFQHYLEKRCVADPHGVSRVPGGQSRLLVLFVWVLLSGALLLTPSVSLSPP